MTGAREWDVVVVGGANTDYLGRAPRLPTAGREIEGDVFLEAPGGKGANQAVAAVRLGARVALVSCLGTDQRGDVILERLVSEGVDTRHVGRDDEAQTGAALIHVDLRGERQSLGVAGASRRLSVADIAAAAPTIRAARVLLASLEVPLESVTAAIRLAREADVRTVLDPAPAMELPDDLLGLVDVIKPNRAEAETLTGIPVTDYASARAAAMDLLRRGVGAVAVEAGTEGDLVVWDGGERWLPHLPVVSVDSTGSGDAFAATLAVGLAEDRSLEEAATLAAAAAALTTTRFGAQTALPRRTEVAELLARFAASPAAAPTTKGGTA